MTLKDLVINPSSLTTFRRLHIQDISLLDRLIQKTVKIALEKQIINSKTIILDATHTKSRNNKKSLRRLLSGGDTGAKMRR